VLRLEIEGSWEPEDFIEVLTGVESLYYKAALSRRLLRKSLYFWMEHFWFERPTVAMSFGEYVDFSNDWLLTRARTIARSPSRLRVARIKYASPGGIDLVGLGEACKAVERIIDRLIKFFDKDDREIRRQGAKQAQIETAMKEESLRSLKIENARAILELHRDYPDMPDEILTALITHDQDKLIPRIAERKLVAVRTMDAEPPPDDEAA
jgi:hypothetical protein